MKLIKNLHICPSRNRKMVRNIQKFYMHTLTYTQVCTSEKKIERFVMNHLPRTRENSQCVSKFDASAGEYNYVCFSCISLGTVYTLRQRHRKGSSEKGCIVTNITVHTWRQKHIFAITLSPNLPY